MNTDIRILEAETFITREKAREPLKFGHVIVEDCLYCHARVKVENGRQEVAEGWGSIFLMDMWGWPSDIVGHSTREDAMLLVTERFCRLAANHNTFGHPIDIFNALQEDLRHLNNVRADSRS
jgi:hypothetical protein